MLNSSQLGYISFGSMFTVFMSRNMFTYVGINESNSDHPPPIRLTHHTCASQVCMFFTPNFVQMWHLLNTRAITSHHAQRHFDLGALSPVGGLIVYQMNSLQYRRGRWKCIFYGTTLNESLLNTMPTLLIGNWVDWAESSPPYVLWEVFSKTVYRYTRRLHNYGPKILLWTIQNSVYPTLLCLSAATPRVCNGSQRPNTEGWYKPSRNGLTPSNTASERSSSMK